MKIPELMPRDRNAKVLDSFTEAGANALAKLIEAKWHACGHSKVRTYTVLIQTELPHKRISKSDTVKASLWAVRSNLINGLPPT